MASKRKGDPVGVQEIAEYLAVQPRTVHQWQFRGVLPDPDYTVNGLPAWERATIRAWATSTGRLSEGPTGELVAARAEA